MNNKHIPPTFAAILHNIAGQPALLAKAHREAQQARFADAPPFAFVDADARRLELREKYDDDQQRGARRHGVHESRCDDLGDLINEADVYQQNEIDSNTPPFMHGND